MTKVLWLIFLLVLMKIGELDAATTSTRIPNSWNVKDCVNSVKVRNARDNCAKNFTNHEDIEKCILKIVGVYDGANVNIEDSKKLVDNYDASQMIKAGLKRDVARCTVPARQRNCIYQVLTKRCLMDPSLKRTGQSTG